jgi:histidinol-phosphate aminotransferase
MDIALYQGGASKAEGFDEVLKLSSNENPFGPSPKAVAAYAGSAGALHRYPSTDHAELRAAIGAVHGLDPALIICGAGSDEILTFLCQTYAGVGDEVIHTEHGFAMYRISALAAGATPVEVAERDRTVDVDLILQAVTDRTRLVFIANPANPTGTMIPLSEVSRLADALPPQVLLVLDGAYAEFAEGYDGGAALISARENVVMTRTFSKLYGLGGLRVGWGYGPAHVIDALNRVRGPFNLGPGQLMAGTAAVLDRAYADFCVVQNAEQRVRLRGALAQLGLPSDESFANFVVPRFANRMEAEAAEAFLRARGILVRKIAGYGLPDHLRITVGRPEDCDRVIAALSDFREAAA